LALLQADVEILQRAVRRTQPSVVPAEKPGQDSAPTPELHLTLVELEVVEEAAAELGHMNRLITDLLTLATYDASKTLLNTQPVFLAPLLTEIAERFRPQLTQASVTLHLLLPADPRPLVVEGDASALRRLVLILLTNASSYTPPGGQIWLQARVGTGHQLELTVRDTGRGIAAADLPHLFTRFYRADKARARQPPVADERVRSGTGLGLAIARSIVESHQGTITVSSPGEGQGSTFTVTLKQGGQNVGRRPSLSNPRSAKTRKPPHA
jgi:signal transduction histidine kinase